METSGCLKTWLQSSQEDREEPGLVEVELEERGLEVLVVGLVLVLELQPDLELDQVQGLGLDPLLVLCQHLVKETWGLLPLLEP